MRKSWMILGTSLLLLILSADAVRADELKTVETASETLRALADIPARCIPYALMREARGVAIIPGVVKAGFVIDGRFGRGVVVARQPDGCWSSPVFITMTGGGVGLQAGVESTDVVLVFRTTHSMDRFQRGKGQLNLGGDLSIAAGPIGREAEAGTDARLRGDHLLFAQPRPVCRRVAARGGPAGRSPGERQLLRLSSRRRGRPRNCRDRAPQGGAGAAEHAAEPGTGLQHAAGRRTAGVRGPARARVGAAAGTSAVEWAAAVAAVIAGTERRRLNRDFQMGCRVKHSRRRNRLGPDGRGTHPAANCDKLQQGGGSWRSSRSKSPTTCRRS